jgi:hypothetical protein
VVGEQPDHGLRPGSHRASLAWTPLNWHRTGRQAQSGLELPDRFIKSAVAGRSGPEERVGEFAVRELGPPAEDWWQLFTDRKYDDSGRDTQRRAVSRWEMRRSAIDLLNGCSS